MFSEAKARDIRIQEEMGFTSFTTDPVHIMLEPSVTSISQTGYKMGSRAALLCISQIESKSTGHKSEVLQTNIIMGKSSIGSDINGDLKEPITYKAGILQPNLLYIY